MYYRDDLTQEYIKSLFDYNPNTGIFTNKIRRGKAGRKGAITGNLKSNSYTNITIKRTTYLAHRIAWLYMTGGWPTKDIDHINGIKTDNRWENLREVTKKQNQMNRKVNKKSKSGYKGVRWMKGTKKWQAMTILGLYNSKEEAALEYNKAVQKLYGKYAWLNEVNNENN